MRAVRALLCAGACGCVCVRVRCRGGDCRAVRAVGGGAVQPVVADGSGRDSESERLGFDSDFVNIFF